MNAENFFDWAREKIGKNLICFLIRFLKEEENKAMFIGIVIVVVMRDYLSQRAYLDFLTTTTKFEQLEICTGLENSLFFFDGCKFLKEFNAKI